MEGQDLASASDPSELLELKIGAAARGCLAIRDLEALADSREVLRTLAAGLAGVEGRSALLSCVWRRLLLASL